LQIGSISLPAFGLGIHGLVYGVILGAFLHLAVQIPGLIKHKFIWAPKIDLKHPGVRQVLTLLGPRILTMFFIQMFFTVRDNLASGLGEGAVSALNLGWFIMQVPETLLGTAIAIAFLPTISEIFVLGDKNKFMETVNKVIRTVLALTIPVAVLLSIGLRPLIKIAFQSIDPAGLELVLIASRVYLFGLASHALLEICSRSFYAQKDAKTPLYAAAFNAFLYLGLAIFLSKILESTGIALANTIAFSIEMLILLFILNRRYPGISKIRNTISRVGVSSLLGGGIFYLILHLDIFSNLSVTYNAILSAGSMAIIFTMMLPFLWKEIKLITYLERNSAKT
jgi:putative peptidoglycan lipid II flippase